MIVPLPDEYADELLWHMSHCSACRWAKLSPNPAANYCERARQLVKLTTEQRHGKVE